MEQIYKNTCLIDFHLPSHLQQLCRSSQANSWGGRRFGKPSLALRGAFVGLRLQWGAAHLAPRGTPRSTGGRRRSAGGWGPISWAADAWVAAGWEGEKWGDWMLKIFIIYLLCIYVFFHFDAIFLYLISFFFWGGLFVDKLYLFLNLNCLHYFLHWISCTFQSVWMFADLGRILFVLGFGHGGLVEIRGKDERYLEILGINPISFGHIFQVDRVAWVTRCICRLWSLSFGAKAPISRVSVKTSHHVMVIQAIKRRPQIHGGSAKCTLPRCQGYEHLWGWKWVVEDQP